MVVNSDEKAVGVVCVVVVDLETTSGRHGYNESVGCLCPFDDDLEATTFGAAGVDASAPVTLVLGWYFAFLARTGQIARHSPNKLRRCDPSVNATCGVK